MKTEREMPSSTRLLCTVETGVTCSDGTATHHAYDVSGNLTNATGSAGFVFDYIYDAASMLTGEIITNGGVTNTLSRLYDAFRRPASTALSAGGVSAQGVAYTHDGAGLLSAVTATNAQGRAFRLEYTSSLGLAPGHRVTTPGGNVITRAVTRDPLRPHLVTGVTNLFNGSVISAWTYRYDAAGRVISRDSDTFAYNTRSELTSALLHTNAYGYVYDPIGNRLVSTINGAETGYTANHLNQYTVINSATPQYDRDGNLIALGDRTYTYDAENRLVAITATNNALVLANTYDHLCRRVRKATPTTTRDFTYDKWNLLRETAISNGVSSVVDYFWGKDISGTLQGAGGVGGLIAASIEGQFYFALYDNNGNVTEFIDESGVVRAHYEYSPFGEVTAQSGDMADVFRFRFSTKYHDPETGHYYYGRRFYVPGLGRWLNRDPIEERGGLNVYGFVGNDGINNWDYLGMRTVKVPKCHAVLIIGHTKKKDPIQWKFPEDGCAYGGVVGCWPDANNPFTDNIWPNVPLHSCEMFSGGWLRDLFDMQSRQHDQFNEGYTEPDFERNPLTAVANAWSKQSLDIIKKRLCGNECCCKEISFEIRVTQGRGDLKNAVKKFNWQLGSTRKIRFSCDRY